MNRDDIIRMAQEAMRHTSIEPNDKVTFYVSYNNGIDADGFCDSVETFIEHFANLVAAAEREKVAHWMMTACYATGHGDTTEDLLRELAWQADERIVKAVAAEREACAALCDKISDEDGFEGGYADRCAHAIRERGAP